MSRRAIFSVVILAVAACSGPSAGPVAGESPVTTTPAQPVTSLIHDSGAVVWEGFAPSDDPMLAARARGPVAVYESMGDEEPMLTLDGLTILGTITVLSVISGPVDGWAEVMLPIRPNESTGWVQAEDVSFYVVDGEILVDLSERYLTYEIDGVEVLRTEVGIGSDHSRTPTGTFFVTDNVTLADPAGPWGPHALGLSARSDTVTEFNGGDGIIGIHGTNNPGSIGQNISLGCVRLPNDMIAKLHEMVPIGTRVTISA